MLLTLLKVSETRRLISHKMKSHKDTNTKGESMKAKIKDITYKSTEQTRINTNHIEKENIQSKTNTHNTIHI